MHNISVLFACFMLTCPSFALEVTKNTIKDLGLCLNAPVFVGDFMAVRSCSEKQVTFIDVNNYANRYAYDMTFEPSMRFMELGDQRYRFLELDDEILLLHNLITFELTLISGGKMQKSPRTTPPPAEFDGVVVNFSYESGTLFASVHDANGRHSSRVIVGQRSLIMKNIIDDIEYTNSSGLIKAHKLTTREITIIAAGSMPSAITKVNERYLITANWGDNTVSFIDKNNHTIVTTVAVDKHPLRPMVHQGKIYISNYGSGSMSVLELINQH